ncbi:uncharacterized protein YndB with AHSA1/START domain [Glaciihabitans tibetensis]|uniref:Uncharacterized protein YndB with AHSA1/START domain n=1 Tax=Glaciihabitans tibetensis TaxID=1266600 RepID=A0A2T0VDT5_9MICO|nr:ATPase [Glaciihabitans tibetensis]PRY68344.1 uncharacterized protein YndB with AHSA1/START domain [Glaciihabitans tibetensis]
MDAQTNTENTFKVVVEREMDAPAQVVFDAITLHTSGWLWPTDFQALQNSTAPEEGVITAWDPPHHYANRMDGPDGFFNLLDHTLEDRDGDMSLLRYIHHGVNLDPDRNQEDAVQQHTDFYLHTLNEYVRHFPGLDAAFVDIQGPAASSSPDAFDRVRDALGLTNSSKTDATVHVTVPGVDPFAATVDYATDNFIGLRTDTALYRFFGRNAFGAVVGMTIHVFDPADDAVAVSSVWQKWLDGLYA